MNFRPLSKREARLVAVLILIALIAAVYLGVIAPLVSGFAERAEQRRELAVRYEANGRIIAAIPRLRRLAEAHNRMAGDYMLAAPDAAVAGELLRQRLQTAVLAVGGEFRGGEDIAAPPRTVATRISARLSWPQLLALLPALENARPFLTISSLSIGADDALITGRATTLDVELETTIPFHPATR